LVLFPSPVRLRRAFLLKKNNPLAHFDAFEKIVLLSHQPLLILTMFHNIQDFDVSSSPLSKQQAENRLCVVAERELRHVVFFSFFSFPLQ